MDYPEGLEDVPVEVLQAVISGTRTLRDAAGYYIVRVDGGPGHDPRVEIAAGVAWKRKPKKQLLTAKP